MRRLLPILALLPLVAACFGGPSETGLSAQAFAEKLAAGQTVFPDECGWFCTPDLRPSNAEEWTASEGSDPQADAVVRGDVVALSTGPHSDTVQLVLHLTSVHGTVAAAVGDDATATVVGGWSETRGDGRAWNSGTLDEVEDAAVAGLT